MNMSWSILFSLCTAVTLLARGRLRAMLGIGSYYVLSKDARDTWIPWHLSEERGGCVECGEDGTSRVLDMMEGKVLQARSLRQVCLLSLNT